jgi:phage terminase small subunit
LTFNILELQMAVAGKKPTASVIKFTTGRKGRRAPSPAEPAGTGRPTPPTALSGRPLAIWRRYVSRATWLSEFDSPTAYAWVHLFAEFERSPDAMPASRIAQMRALANELGFDPGSRARLGHAAKPAGLPDAVDYFNRE